MAAVAELVRGSRCEQSSKVEIKHYFPNYVKAVRNNNNLCGFSPRALFILSAVSGWPGVSAKSQRVPKSLRSAAKIGQDKDRMSIIVRNLLQVT